MSRRDHMSKYEQDNKRLFYITSVSSAKPRVDCAPPKALYLSQKRRDVMERRRSKSAKVTSTGSPNLKKEQVPTAYNQSSARFIETPRLYEDFDPPRSSTQNKFVNTLRNSYDPLDYHDHYFTQPTKPFTPRINCYAEGTSSALRHHKNAYDYEPAEHSQETKKAPQRSKAAAASMVPRLDIGGETEVTASGGGGSEFNYAQWRCNIERKRREKEEKNRLYERTTQIIEQVRHSHDAELEKQNEELAYLEFVREVTADIVRRNISTNSVIKQAFEWHINQHKHNLDEDKMRAHLSGVSRELGLVDS